MTLTTEHDLDSAKLNQPAKYLGWRSFRSKIILRAHGHTPDRLHLTWTTK